MQGSYAPFLNCPLHENAGLRSQTSKFVLSLPWLASSG